MLRLALLISLGCGLAIAVSSPTPAAPLIEPQPIPWSAGRPLNWDDFLGAVDRNAPTERVALTAASLSWSYEYELQLDAGKCSYWITGIHAQAVFNPGDSWVKPEHRTAAVLGHEQGHFDISQVYKLLLDERARAMIDVSQTCEGRTIKKASAFTERRIAEQVGLLFDDVWQQFASTQESYDDQTAHGLATETQSAWAEKIHRALHLGHWQEFLDELEQ